MTDEKNPVQVQRIEQADQIADYVERRVAGRARWRVGVTVAAKVGGDGAVAEVGEVEHLVAPGVPELREAVEEEHGWTGADLSYVHVYPVCLDGAVLDFLHW